MKVSCLHFVAFLCVKFFYKKSLKLPLIASFILLLYYRNLFYAFQLVFPILILCLIIFLLNKTSLDSLNSVAIFTPLAVFDSLSLIFFRECIFDFNPTNSIHLSLLTSLKNFWIITKVEQIFPLKKFFIGIFWFYFISQTACISKQ